MNNKEHIENVIRNTFRIIREVYHCQRENKNNLGESSKESRIIFPSSCKGETRISEQELRFIFVEQLNKEIGVQGEKWDVYYSVETPTKGGKYCFPKKEKGDNTKEKPFYNDPPKIKENGEIDKRGDSANFDLVIFDNRMQRIALIEFKSNNRGDHEKDVFKLEHPIEIGDDKEKMPLRFFIEVIKNADINTIKSLYDKMGKKETGIEFRYCVLDDIRLKCLNKKEIEVIKENGGDISELVRNSEHLC